LQVLEHGRHDQLVAVRAEQVEDAAPQAFDAQRLDRQDVFDVLGQQPASHDGAPCGQLRANRTRIARPTSTRTSPKKRSWPSARLDTWRTTARQRAGASSSGAPSITSTRANAVQKIFDIQATRAGSAARASAGPSGSSGT